MPALTIHFYELSIKKFHRFIIISHCIKLTGSVSWSWSNSDTRLLNNCETGWSNQSSKKHRLCRIVVTLKKKQFHLELYVVNFQILKLEISFKCHFPFRAKIKTVFTASCVDFSKILACDFKIAQNSNHSVSLQFLLEKLITC